MKKISVVIKPLLLIIPLLLIFSCKKDPVNPHTQALVIERVSIIHGLKGGIDDFKEEYHYSGGYLSEYYIYRPGKDGEWKNWIRLSYDYPSDDEVVEVREGFADSIWFPANKNEKQYHGRQLKEIVNYEYDMGFTGNWRPVKKISWDFAGDRQTERTTWVYNSGWEESKRSVYKYTGSLWTGLLTYEIVNGSWDTTGCMALIYKDGNLAEVNVYKCQQIEGWSHFEQYVMHYQGSRLTDMMIYTCPGDGLEWESTITVGYNENGFVNTYLTDYECCPTEEIRIEYEEGWGNFREATLGYSNYMLWPWFPAPEKK